MIRLIENDNTHILDDRALREYILDLIGCKINAPIDDLRISGGINDDGFWCNFMCTIYGTIYKIDLADTSLDDMLDNVTSQLNKIFKPLIDNDSIYIQHYDDSEAVGNDGYDIMIHIRSIEFDSLNKLQSSFSKLLKRYGYQV